MIRRLKRLSLKDGRRLDYFLIDKRLEDKVEFDIKTRDDVYGSDHLPLELIFEM